MKKVQPTVTLVAYPTVDWDAIRSYLADIGPEAPDWADRVEGQISDGEGLVEFGGRLCYRSWAPGLNANVTRVRTDSAEYLGNIVSSAHGSVLEHANYSFVLHNVSRVLTHEMVRHRAGVAVSQESMRYVRLDNLPFWFPDWALQDNELMSRCIEKLHADEALQIWMAGHFGLDDPGVPFAEKKAKTSFMRRFAPGGVATDMLVTINIRALRHIIAIRTALPAEEEIRLVCDQIAEACVNRFPLLMADYHRSENAEWIPAWLKI